MFRYTSVLLGITLFAMALIWTASPGDAVQLPKKSEPVIWADTIHINLDEGPNAVKQDSAVKTNDNFLRGLSRLSQTAQFVRNQYMEDVDMDKIIKAGIVGMMSDLDRFSVLMEKTSYDALMESTHGKYEGLGMMIDQRDDRIIIISPIEGTPAYRKGLRAGDVIMSIDSNDTHGMKTSDASKLMRGKAGTTVKLGIKRAGLGDPMEFEVERAQIELKSVNYAGMVPGTTVGYVRLSRFAEETSHELRQAITDLNNAGATSMIFDLRSNGGGLLDQAKETAELFLKEGSEIVYTRGKSAETERHYKSERPPIWPADKPLVILVDEGTASASEIVSGAIQDWDRGLIMGATTYGKGLVQQIFPIDANSALKITTAKYYVPSGRCIQKAEKQGKDHADAFVDEDSLNIADSLEISKREIFHTNGGRIVYGGGGIVPDIMLDRETWKPIEINLERKSMFFDFAVDYLTKHPETKTDFQVTDNVINDFKEFLKDKKFTYKSTLQMELDQLQKAVATEHKEETFKGAIANMNALIEKEKETDFTSSNDYIRRAIKREIISSVAGERGVYEQIVLKDDKSVKRALEVLNSPKEYTKLIAEVSPQKKKS
jgi:carboxyl-terminal processing protease